MTKAAICLGLVGAVATVTGPLAQAAAPPAREGCSWHRHSKRVVKHVKRGGRVHRVKRLKHWWTCDAEPAVSAPPPTPPVPAPPAPPPFVPLPHEEPAPEGPASHLSVKAAEWSYTLSRPEVSSGDVVIELNNQGEDNHNLKLQREAGGEPPLSVPEAAPDERTTARVSLPPGTYRLYCSLFQHDEKGMHATLLVGEG